MVRLITMAGKYLLDTNIIVAILNGELEIQSRLEPSNTIFIPSIAVGELCYGAHKSARTQSNLERVDELIVKSTVLECDAETAKQYGELKNNLRLKGRPLPENDIWIAAIALQHQLTLVTRDAHFQEIETMQTVAW